MFYSSADVISLLDSIDAPFETEVVEFKEAKSGFKFNELGQYLSALSNEALLRGHSDAWLFFGMTDDKEACGTSYRAGNPKSLQGLKRDIATHVSGRLTFREIHELDYRGKRVLAFQIPAAIPGMPTAFNNATWAREGDSLVPLPVDKYEEIRQMSRPDWSAKALDNASVEDLDPRAVDTAVEMFLKKHERHGDAFAGASAVEILDTAGITVNGMITPTAIILLGKPESVHLLDSVMPRITWTLYASDGSVVAYEHFEPPLLLAVDRVLGKIRNERYRFLANGESLFPVELSQYEPDIIRELLHNCLAHQDYSMQGRVNVEEFEDHLVFINEGAFIPETIEKAMQTGYKPSYYRNLFLCQAMVQLDMIDTIAMGIPKMFQMQRKRYFPLPSYDLSDPGRVVVSIYGKSINESYSRLLYARPDLPLDIVYLLDKVQKGEEISVDQAAKLHDMGLVEGRHPLLTISSSIAVKTDSVPEYIRSKGLTDSACKALILQMLDETGPAKRSKIIAMLGDLLPNTMTDAQRKKKVSNLLSSMKNIDHTIENTGVGKSAVWKLV